MSSTLPVPSKAALTALRGLIVGTSCTLALVAEDRRRRINGALTVIENGRKLKGVRNYHPPAGAELAITFQGDDDAIGFPWPYEPSAISKVGKDRGKPAARSHRERRVQSAENPATIARASESKATTTQVNGSHSVPSVSATVEPALDKPSPFIQALPAPPTPSISLIQLWKPPDIAAVDSETHDFPTDAKIIRSIHQASSSKSEAELDEVLHLVLSAFKDGVAPKNDDKLWIQATAVLCRTLQEAGKVDASARLLHYIVSNGDIEESDYFAHQPLELVETLIAQDDISLIQQTRPVRRLDIETTIFLPRFNEKPRDPNSRVVNIGRKLLERSFELERLRDVENIFWRCISYHGDNAWELTEWFVAHLHDAHDPRLAIKHFLLSYTKMSPAADSIRRVGNCVVEAVEAAHNYKAGQVLRALRDLCSSAGAKMRTQWAMKLLQCHWQKDGDIQATEALCQELMSDEFRGLVPHSDCLNRIMIELALELGDTAKAEHYFALLVAERPEISSDVRILGRFALAKAKQGDWKGVETYFQDMKVDGSRASTHHGQVFVPILKVYTKDHTLAETAQFLRFYVSHFKVPLSRFMVTLMATQYGSQQDVKLFMQWLEYCANAGFEIDSTFAHAILQTCKRHWHFPFQDLRRVFLNLRTLNPKCINRATEHMMLSYAIAEGGERYVRARVVSLGIDPVKLARQGKVAPKRDVVLAMREALSCSRPLRAVQIYKRAVHLGMPFSPYALKLAVQASLDNPRLGARAAYSLVQSAQERGQDASQAITCILVKQLERIRIKPNQPGKEQVISDIQHALGEMESEGIVLDEVILHRAASLCIKARHFAGAISYALRAVLAGGHSGPCYSLFNFSILIRGYTQLLDVDSIRDAISKALVSSYRADWDCLNAMRVSRMMLRTILGEPSVDSQRATHALEALNYGIQQARLLRKHLTWKRDALENDVMQIMTRAAADADRTLELDLTPLVVRPPPQLAGEKPLTGVLEINRLTQKRSAVQDMAQPADPAMGPSDVDNDPIFDNVVDSPPTSSLATLLLRQHVQTKESTIQRSRKGAHLMAAASAVGGNGTADPLTASLLNARFEAQARSAPSQDRNKRRNEAPAVAAGGNRNLGETADPLAAALLKTRFEAQAQPVAKAAVSF